jgi:hypothetical protein
MVDELSQSLCFNLQFQPRITRIESMKEISRSTDMEFASEASGDARVTMRANLIAPRPPTPPPTLPSPSAGQVDILS